jgi:succinyl-CoA synthetase alpha subunit
MKEFGTNVVAGMTPGKGGQEVEGVPVFDSVAEAMTATSPNTSIIFVPAPFAKDSVFEAMDNGIKTVVIITERIPVHDMAATVDYATHHAVTIIGPNTPGIVTPGETKVGIMPSKIFVDGHIGVISRSGTLTYEIVDSITRAGYGQSTCLGLGGDPITGMSFVDALALFDKDKDTDAVVIVGEIGGTAEEEASEFIKTMHKPVCAYIAGQTAPPGKRMGHAGAIITRGKGTAESKIKALTAAGASVARLPAEIGELVKKVL